MQTHDALGRMLPDKQVSTGRRIRLQPFDYFLFEKLNWHGFLPNKFIHAYAKEFGRSSWSMTKERIRHLHREDNNNYGKPFLRRPPLQYPDLPGGYKARNHHIVYALGLAGKEALGDKYITRYSHKGKWEHELMRSIITASIELSTFPYKTYTFIPEHRILRDRSKIVPIDITTKKKTYKTRLIPDDVFAVDYGDHRRIFFLEADRGTEDVGSVETSVFYEKTLARSFRQYREFIGERIYKEAYQVEHSASALFVFTNEKRMHNAIELLKKICYEDGFSGNNYILFKCLPQCAKEFYQAPPPLYHLFTDPWLRAGKPPFNISDPQIEAAS